MLSKHTVLERWEQYYGATLSRPLRRKFLECCSPLTKYNEGVLCSALIQSRKDQNFKINHIKQIADTIIETETTHYYRRHVGLRFRPRTSAHGSLLDGGRSRDRHSAAKPIPPSDLELHRKIGPTQNYWEDT